MTDGDRVNPVREEDMWALIQSVARSSQSQWACGACWGGVKQDQTECYRCGVELTAHPQDEHREPWQGK